MKRSKTFFTAKGNSMSQVWHKVGNEYDAYLQNAPTDLTVREFKESHLGKRCLGCNTVMTRDNISIDHVLPKNKFPHLMFDYRNLQCLCQECNKKKGSSTEAKTLSPRLARAKKVLSNFR